MKEREIYSSQQSWQINHYNNRYAQSASARKPLVLISGWSCDSKIFEWLMPGLAQHFVIVTAELINVADGQSFAQCCDELASSLFDEFTQPMSFLGWSLGGNVAIELAHKQPALCEQLLVLASSPVFVNQGDVSWAMPNDVFNVFQQQVESNSVDGLLQFDRLMLSATDKSQLRPLRSALKDYRQQQADSKHWSHSSLCNSLRHLAQLDQRQALIDLNASDIQVQAILFADDAIVNCAASKAYLNVDVIAGASHLGFLTHTEKVYGACLKLLQTSSSNVLSDTESKRAVAASFSQAAVKYDSASEVQQRIAQKLLDKLLLSTSKADVASRYIVDAGCGTGLWTNKLNAYAEHVTGVDFADGMLNYAKAKYPNVKHWVQADLETMALVPKQTDTIFSSLAIQWCTDTSSMLEHWFSLLKPGGEVFIATLATDTLHELAACFASIDKQAHVNDFFSYQELKHFIKCSSFELVSSEHETEQQFYNSPVALMHDLKAIGAQTIKTKSGLVKPSPLTKTQLSKLSTFYQRYCNDEQQLPATYDVVYLHLKKPIY